MSTGSFGLNGPYSFGPNGPYSSVSTDKSSDYFLLQSWYPILHVASWIFQKDMEERIGRRSDPRRYSGRHGEMEMHVKHEFERFKQELVNTMIFPAELCHCLVIEVVNRPAEPHRMDLRILIGENWKENLYLPKSNLGLRLLSELVDNPKELSEKYQEDISHVKYEMNQKIQNTISETNKRVKEKEATIDVQRAKLDDLNNEIKKLEELRTDVMEQMREKVRAFELEV